MGPRPAVLRNPPLTLAYPLAVFSHPAHVAGPLVLSARAHAGEGPARGVPIASGHAREEPARGVKHTPLTLAPVPLATLPWPPLTLLWESLAAFSRPHSRWHRRRSRCSRCRVTLA